MGSLPEFPSHSVGMTPSLITWKNRSGSGLVFNRTTLVNPISAHISNLATTSVKLSMMMSSGRVRSLKCCGSIVFAQSW